jgi:hypothetical protein
MREYQMTQIPLWVVASLGKQIALSTEFVGSCETYTKGCRGTLSAIMVDSNYNGMPYAVVALDPEDETYLENFRFDEIEPLTSKIKFSLNIERGIMAF